MIDVSVSELDLECLDAIRTRLEEEVDSDEDEREVESWVGTLNRILEQADIIRLNNEGKEAL